PCLNVQFDGGFARSLAGSRVGARALTAHRQSLAMARAAVAAEIDQALDRHLHFAAQVALDGELLHVLAQAVELGVGQVLDLARALHAGGGADGLRAGAADAIDRGQRDLGVLVVRDVDSCNAGHRRNLKLYLFSQGLINLDAVYGADLRKSPAPHPCAARSCTCGRFSSLKPSLS